MSLSSKQVACLLVLLVAGFSKTTGQTAPRIDIAKLIRSAQLNGEMMSKRVFDYSWKSKTLVRQYKRSRLQKTLEQIHEVYPAQGLTFVAQKLVMENGQPLSTKRARKEQKRLQDELLNAQMSEAIFAEAADEATTRTGCPTFGIWTVLNGVGGKETSLGISDFLCFAEFSAPRLERKDGRETVVLRFHPRDGLDSLAKEKTPFTKLSGTVWIDLKDKIATHIEAWSGEIKTETPLPSSPPAVVFDDMRLADGTWVRRSRYIDTRANTLAFNGLNLEWKQEFSEYKRYYTEFKDLKIVEPEESRQSPP